VSNANINSNDVEQILNDCEQRFSSSRVAGEVIVAVRTKLRELVSKAEGEEPGFHQNGV
jgi:hypothetical protein